jgi:tRNA pseudouridine55 synthase
LAMKNGIILLDKEAGFTSRDVDNILEKRLQADKIGHLGTLDPFATGLLVLGINKGTKFLPYIDDGRKSYIACLRLGEKTSTLDTESPVIETKEVPAIDETILEKTFVSLLGKQEQLPPMTSAVKVDGIPLYKSAHLGKEVERKKRNVEVFSLNVVSFSGKDLVFTCTVSRGTYIRVLGETIAERLGTLGHLVSLRRLSIGMFLVEKAKKVCELTETDILDPTVFVTTMKHVEIDEQDLPKVKNGQTMMLEEDYGEKVLLVLHGDAVAVYAHNQGRFYVCERGLY